MTEKRKFRCRNCGHRFEAAVLTESEERERRRRNEPMGQIACPHCKRQDIVPGWE